MKKDNKTANYILINKDTGQHIKNLLINENPNNKEINYKIKIQERKLKI